MKRLSEIPEFRRRYRYLVAAVLLTFGLLVGRLWQLQVLRGEHYRRVTEGNFIQERSIPTVRGAIVDRERRVLASNRPSFDVYVDARRFGRRQAERLIEELGLEEDRAAKVREQGKAGRRVQRAQRALLLRDISRDQLARLEMRKTELRGVHVVAVTHRHYPHGELAAHLLGYMNEVTASELARDRQHLYQPGELIGRFGVERMYEAHLRGIPGQERFVVDAWGRRRAEAVTAKLIDGPTREEPKPGHHIVLTLDLDLQRLVERTMGRHPSGAAVVIEAQSGRVLASASRPAFDANRLTARLTAKEARELIEDPYRPLLDKVYREHYFPGSTYKVVTAAAAVEEGVVDWEEMMTCKGWHHFGRRNFRCGHVHGQVSLHRAIVESCNVFFYALAERIGMDTLARYARTFGLGASTGLGLNGEVSGFIPTKAWYAQSRRRFRVGYTLNAAIGQGNVKVTPIQVAMLYAAVANGGKLYAPQVVERIETTDGRILQQFEPQLRRRIAVDSRTLARVHDALVGVFEESKGTAHQLRPTTVRMAGKTGTAQVTRRGHKTSEWLNDHAWFAAYAPAERPEIVVVVLIEHGGQAAKVAAPIAVQIVDGYFAPAKAAAQAVPSADEAEVVSAQGLR